LPDTGGGGRRQCRRGRRRSPGAATATDEPRTCALNNHADIHDDRGEPAAAIADRTAVLSLAETTYDRRYIAYARRCTARRR
jgi:hypothetical protein